MKKIRFAYSATSSQEKGSGWNISLFPGAAYNKLSYCEQSWSIVYLQVSALLVTSWSAECPGVLQLAPVFPYETEQEHLMEWKIMGNLARYRFKHHPALAS